MRSGGFGLGKKQNRTDEIRRAKPTSADLTQLLSSSQKSPDKSFSMSWQTSSNCIYTLSVMNCGSQRDRRGWSSSAIDNSGVGEAEWKLSQEIDSLRSEIFSMKCSDSYLIGTLIEEALATGAAPFASGAIAQPAAMPAQQEWTGSSNAPTPSVGSTPGLVEGSLRQTKIRDLLQSFNTNKTTGRLICDIGTVQSEVFLTSGEPVHAKSSHSISQGRDTMGDVSLIDLLTWNDGTYKFQEGWPAASKSISSPLSMFLDGTVVPELAPAPAAQPAPSAAPQAAAKAPTPPVTSDMPYDFVPGSYDDFSNVDDLIGATYSGLVETSGLLKIGMLLMLVRSEFVRFEKGQVPFCFAAIDMSTPAGGHLSDTVLSKIGERFEKVCQPLDTLAYAGGARFYALFPQTEITTAQSAIKQFINNIVAIPLDTNLHGSAVKATVGLSEVPRNGVEFQHIFEQSCTLRREASPGKIVIN